MLKTRKIAEFSGLLALLGGSLLTLPCHADPGEGPDAIQSALDRLYLQKRNAFSSKTASSKAAASETDSAEQELFSIFNRRAEKLQSQKKAFYLELSRYTYHPDGEVTVDGAVDVESQKTPDFDPDLLPENPSEKEPATGSPQLPLPYAGPLSPEFQAGQAGKAGKEEPVIHSKDGPREFVFPGKKASPTPR